MNIEVRRSTVLVTIGVRVGGTRWIDFSDFLAQLPKSAGSVFEAVVDVSLNPYSKE